MRKKTKAKEQKTNETIELMRWRTESAKTVIFSAGMSFFRAHSCATGEKKGRFSRKKGVFMLVWFPVASTLVLSQPAITRTEEVLDKRVENKSVGVPSAASSIGNTKHWHKEAQSWTASPIIAEPMPLATPKWVANKVSAASSNGLCDAFIIRSVFVQNLYEMTVQDLDDTNRFCKAAFNQITSVTSKMKGGKEELELLPV